MSGAYIPNLLCGRCATPWEICDARQGAGDQCRRNHLYSEVDPRKPEMVDGWGKGKKEVSK